MQIGFLDDISFLFEEIIVIGILGILGWLINHFRNKAKDVEKLRKEVRDIRDKELQARKVMILLATLTDEQAKKLHPKEFIEFEGIIKDMLNDRHNNSK